MFGGYTPALGSCACGVEVEGVEGNVVFDAVAGLWCVGLRAGGLWRRRAEECWVCLLRSGGGRGLFRLGSGLDGIEGVGGEECRRIVDLGIGVRDFFDPWVRHDRRVSSRVRKAREVGSVLL